MRLGAMLGNGGGVVARLAAGMAGHPSAAVKDFHRGGGGAYFYFLLDQLVGSNTSTE